MSTARLGLFAIALTSACEFGPQYCEGDWAVAEAEPTSTTMSRLVAQVNPVDSNAVDILFVIDDSKSMTDEQEQLGIWSNELFDVLGSSGELPDLHIGVTSSSFAILERAGCQTGTAGTFLVGDATLQQTKYITDVAGPEGRVRNYSGPLTETFAKMARVGDGGCGFEQPFKAARTALTNGKTNGFLRPDALLLVVFVTDEDDCSATTDALFGDAYADACSDLGPITSYRCFEHGVKCHDGQGSRVLGERTNCRPDEESLYIESVVNAAASLERLKQQPGQVIVAGIYGKPNHITAIRDERITTYTTPRLADVCGHGGAEGDGATPAVRMNALMAAFGGRASHSSICERELSWAMRDVGLVTRAAATRSPCLRGAVADTEVSVPGLQPACRVEAVRGMGREQTRELIPPCDRSTGSRCFTLEADPLQCGDTDSQLAVLLSGETGKDTLQISCDVYDDAIARDPSVSDPRALDQ